MYTVSPIQPKSLPGKEIPGIPLSLQPWGQAGHFTAHHQIRKTVGQPEQQPDHREIEIDGSASRLLSHHGEGEDCTVHRGGQNSREEH